MVHSTSSNRCPAERRSLRWWARFGSSAGTECWPLQKVSTANPTAVAAKVV